MMVNAAIKMKGYAIGVVLGLLAGTLLYVVQPVQWQGQTLVRIGQISQNQSQSLEPLATVMERIKSRSFIQAVANRAKRNEIVELLSVDEDAGLTIKPTRNADSLIITVSGNSAELVQAAIDSIVEELVSKHNSIIDAYKTDIRKELSRLDLELDVLSKRLATLLDGQTIANPRLTEYKVMVTQHDIDYKLNRTSLLRESISSASIRPTSPIELASISKKRIFSKLWRASLFGALVGIVLSAIWAQWKKNRRTL